MNNDNQLYQSILGPAIITGILLLIPLVAMQFSNEVVWTLSDFIFAGVLLFGTGLAYKLLTQEVGHTVYKVATGLALASALFLVWANMAVGIIGSEDNTFNLLNFGVISVGLIGAGMARFRPAGMARTLFAMALTQGLIALTALFIGMSSVPGSSVYEILAVNGFFMTLFVLAALLFRHDAQKHAPAHASSEG